MKHNTLGEGSFNSCKRDLNVLAIVTLISELANSC